MIPNWIERRANNPELIAEVMRVLKTRHQGRKQAATKGTLIFELFGIGRGDAEYETTERMFRRCVELADAEHGGLIVSDAVAGYWWAESLDDGLEPAEKNMLRARTIHDNAKKLVENLKAEYGGQMGLL